MNKTPGIESKSAAPDLAIFGRPPAFPEKLHVGRPNLGNRDRLFQRINDMLDRNWLTNDGPYVREFEQRITQFTGARHCVAMCNGTISLEIAIRALGLTGEVIVPSFTFVATAHSLQWQEITPVFCDINPQTHNLDPGANRENDYAAHQRHHRRAYLGPPMRHRRTRSDCTPSKLAAPV